MTCTGAASGRWGPTEGGQGGARCLPIPPFSNFFRDLPQPSLFSSYFHTFLSTFLILPFSYFHTFSCSFFAQIPHFLDFPCSQDSLGSFFLLSPRFTTFHNVSLLFHEKSLNEYQYHVGGPWGVPRVGKEGGTV